MTGVRALTIGSRVQAPASREPVARVEKPNASSGLHRKPASDDSEPTEKSRARRSSRESRFETDAVPLWDGPLLRAPFVAQVLGQVFAGAKSRSSPNSAAYGNDDIPCGLLLDKTV